MRRAHAARQNKLIVWNPAALAPQVDKILQEQCYAYAKQAGIKDNEIDYSIIGSAQILPKLVASLEAGNPPDITRIGTNNAQVYRSQGHLLDVTDMVNKMNTQAGGLFPVSLASVMHKGRAYSIPQSVSPWPLVTRLDVLEPAKVDPPKTWMNSSRSVRSCRSRRDSPALAPVWVCIPTRITT